MVEQKDIIVTDTLGIIRTDIEVEYLAHLLCLGGTCRFSFNGKEFELHSGDLSIIRRRSLIEKIRPSDDFRCKIIYARPDFIALSTPQSNYGRKGSCRFSITLWCISRRNSKLFVSGTLTSWSNASVTQSIVSIARRLLMLCRPPFSISSISMPVSTAIATFPHRTPPL